VSLQEPTEALDAHGQPVKTWATAATVWAGVEPLRGREKDGDAQDINELDTRVVLRYRSDITVDWRVLFEGRYFQVLVIVDSGMRHRELELLCKEAF